MSETKENYSHEDLMRFIAQPDALDILANIAYSTYPEDQEYTAGAVNFVLKYPSFQEMDKHILDSMSGEILQKVTNHILKNQTIGAIDLGKTSSSFQDMVMKLRQMSAEGHADMAKALMMFGVEISRFEYLEHQTSIPYDEDIHGPISFSTPNSPKEGV